jgi:uncharacterized damage-inducible protein DinB
LFAYHFHTNQRLLDGAARLDPAAYTADDGYGYGSLHQVFVHLLNTDQAYRGSLETGQRPPRLDPAAFPGLPAVQAGFAREQAAWEALLASLTAEAIESPLPVVMRTGVTVSIPRWHMLQQVILHGQQHHAELAQMLTVRGQSPGDLDFIAFV